MARKWQVLLAGVGVANLLVFLPFLISGELLAPMDMLDGRLVLSIHEHWYRVLAGEAEWNRIPFFWPLANTLSFSDGLFFSGVVYALPRVLGADPYLSTYVLISVWLLIGFSGMFYLIRKLTGGVTWNAFMMGLLFASGSLVHNAIAFSHLQLLVVFLLPWIILAWWEGLVRGKVLWLVAGSVLAGLSFMTGYYVSWYAVFFAMCLLVVGFGWVLIQYLRGTKIRLTWLERTIPRNRICLIVLLLLTFAVSLLPFAVLYFPTHAEYGRAVQEAGVSVTIPGAKELLYMGEYNFLWQGVYRWFGLPSEPFPQARSLGFGPLLFAVFLAAGFLAFRHYWQGRKEADAGERNGWVLLLFLVTVLCLVLNFRVGEFSLWRWVQEFVPGASAIRFNHRFNYVLIVPMLIVVGHALSLPACRRGAFPVAALLFLLLVEQQPFRTSQYFPSLEVMKNRYAHVPSPPADAKVFYITTKESSDKWQYAQLDALHIAQHFDLETVNGYSGVYPRDFWLHDPTENWYADEVLRWIKLKGGKPETLYALDWEEGRWRKVDAPTKLGGH